MPDFAPRKIVVTVEEIIHEGGPPPAVPRRRGAAMALVRNPFAGRYVAELEGAMEDLKPLGLALTDRLITAQFAPAAAPFRVRPPLVAGLACGRLLRRDRPDRR